MSPKLNRYNTNTKVTTDRLPTPHTLLETILSVQHHCVGVSVHSVQQLTTNTGTDGSFWPLEIVQYNSVSVTLNTFSFISKVSKVAIN